MVRNTLFGFLALLAIAPSSQANVFISISNTVPTTGLPNYSTFTLSVTADFGSIVAFDFGTSANYGLFGTMNQVNPGGLPTVFTDNNAAIASSAHVSQDSQFLFNSANLVVLPGSASESSNSLRAAFGSAVPFGTTVPFVQITKQFQLVPLHIIGAVSVLQGANVVEIPIDVIYEPEPASIILLGIAAAAVFSRVRRR